MVIKTLIYTVLVTWCVTISFCVSVVLHELGHLLCGRLSGYKFSSFRLLKWLWVKDENGRIKVSKGAGISAVLGQCLMEPPENEHDFRFVLYNLGGGLVNIITGLVFVVLFIFADSTAAGLALYGMCIPALYLGIVSLVPITKGIVPNDGANIREAHKSADAKHGFYLMLKLNADMAKGIRITDYDESVFAVREGADLSNYLVANIVTLRAAQLEAQGAYEQSYQEMLRLDLSLLPSFYEGVLILSLMFHELVYFGDESYTQRARVRIDQKAKDKSFQRLLLMNHPTFVILNAAKTGLLDNDTEKANNLIARTRRLTPLLQSPGQEEILLFMSDKLESRLNSHQRILGTVEK